MKLKVRKDAPEEKETVLEFWLEEYDDHIELYCRNGKADQIVSCIWDDGIDVKVETCFRDSSLFEHGKIRIRK